MKHLFEYNNFEDWFEESEEAQFLKKLDENFTSIGGSAEFMYMYYDNSIIARDGILTHAKSKRFFIDNKNEILKLIKSHGIADTLELLEKNSNAQIAYKAIEMKKYISTIDPKNLKVGRVISFKFEFECDDEYRRQLTIEFDSVTFPNDELRMLKIGKWKFDTFEQINMKYNLEKFQNELNGGNLCRLLIDKYIL